MHIGIELLFVSPPPTCTTCDAGICIIKDSNGVDIGIRFYSCSGLYCRISHGFIKSGSMIWLTICEEYHYPLDVLTVGVCGFISLTLVHQRLCMLHPIISRCSSCRIKCSYLVFKCFFICTGIGFIFTDDLSVIVYIASVFVSIISDRIFLFPRELHQRDPALFVRIRPFIIFRCCRINKAVDCSLQSCHFPLIIHTPRHVQHQHDIERHRCLSHYLRC